MRDTTTLLQVMGLGMLDWSCSLNIFLLKFIWIPGYSDNGGCVWCMPIPVQSHCCPGMARVSLELKNSMPFYGVTGHPSSEAEFPLEVTPPTTPPTNPPTNLSTDPPDLPVDISDPPNVGNKSEGSSTSEERTSRYPTRTRRPPERFQ